MKISKIGLKKEMEKEIKEMGTEFKDLDTTPTLTLDPFQAADKKETPAVQLHGGSFFHSMMPSIWDCSGKERLYFRLAISIKDCTSSRGVWRMAAISTVTGG